MSAARELEALHRTLKRLPLDKSLSEEEYEERTALRLSIHARIAELLDSEPKPAPAPVREGRDEVSKAKVRHYGDLVMYWANILGWGNEAIATALNVPPLAVLDYKHERKVQAKEMMK